ncbi:MAG: ThiF family adenylyltransferase [bacterium]|nr:ThiF family adenylyltransferase [bacterium]
MGSVKPILLDAAAADASGAVRYGKAGEALVRLPDGSQRHVPPDHQYDVTQATIFGLNERLTAAATSPVVGAGGHTLRDEFNDEWNRYAEAMGNTGAGVTYGVYAYYAERNDLVRYCPKYWHRVVAVASNAKLISDPIGELSWREIRDIFDASVIAVAGASVGGSIIHAVAMDIRPDNLKIADKSLYKMENINRVRLGYWDMVRPNADREAVADMMLRNKADVTAAQLYSIDPYLNVYVYNEGITEKNIARFFEGEGEEPPINILIEEVDDPRIKLLLREEARRRRVPLIMATDVGSAVQLDISRYDLDGALPLTYGTSDEELYEKMNAVYGNPGDRKTFFAFVDALLGTQYRQGELALVIEGKTEIPTSTIIPQLGSTIAVAAGIVAETAARILLGETYPPRVFFNKRTFEAKRFPPDRR